MYSFKKKGRFKKDYKTGTHQDIFE